MSSFRQGNAMLSRVADSIYWMSRYVERVENLSRFIDVTLNLMLDLPVGSSEPWQPLVSTTGDHEYFFTHYPEANKENVIHFLTFDRDYPSSILNCLRFARENARSIRETISSEMWEHLNRFYYVVLFAAESGKALESPSEFFNEIRMLSHLFKGVTDGTMSHGEGWHFARLGCLLERSDKTSRILDVKYYILHADTDGDSPMDELQWQALLRSVSGLEMYRQKHHRITPQRVTDFLLLDREFPRAIHHCILQAAQSIRAISGKTSRGSQNQAENRVNQLCDELAYTRVDDILDFGLHKFLDALQTKLNSVGDGINTTFLSLEPLLMTQEQ